MASSEQAGDLIVAAPTWTETTFTASTTLPLHPYWYAWGCCDGQSDGGGGGGSAEARIPPHGTQPVPVPVGVAVSGMGYLRVCHWEAVSRHPVCSGDMGSGACRRCGRWEAADRTAAHRMFGVTVCPALAGNAESVITLLRLHRQHASALFFDGGGGELLSWLYIVDFVEPHAW